MKINRRIYSKQSIIIVLLILTLFLSPQINASKKEWNIQIVDSDFDNGMQTGIEIDNDGNPRIFYDYDDDIDTYNGNLSYAKLTNNSWEIETVDEVGNVWCNFVLDKQGFPHISYPTSSNVEYSYLKYTRWDGIDWKTEIVDQGKGVGVYSSIDLDSNSMPHIVYTEDMEKSYLVYAYKSGSEWLIEKVDNETSFGETSLKIDSEGNPHVSYLAGDNDLKYAYKINDQWNVETVDSEGSVGWDSSLELDSMDRPHVSYSDYTNHNLKYTKITEKGWEIEVADDSKHAGYYTSLALDSEDKPHISHITQNIFSLSESSVKYARKTSKGWDNQIIEKDEKSTFYYSSIDLDKDNNPHISYRHMVENNEYLKYATRNISNEEFNEDHDTVGFTFYTFLTASLITYSIRNKIKKKG